MQENHISEDVQAYLREHFQDVEANHSAQKTHYVFNMKTTSGQIRRLSVHRELLLYSELLAEYLRKYDIARQLELTDVEIGLESLFALSLNVPES